MWVESVAGICSPQMHGARGAEIVPCVVPGREGRREGGLEGGTERARIVVGVTSNVYVNHPHLIYRDDIFSLTLKMFLVLSQGARVAAAAGRRWTKQYETSKECGGSG